MNASIHRIDNYIAHKGYISLADDVVWQQIIDRVLSLYGPHLQYRCIGVAQQVNPLARYSNIFPDNLTAPLRHIKYIELLVEESSTSQQLVDWLHSLGVLTQRVWQTANEDDHGALRIFGYADPNVARDSSTENV
jgi:hypothetical protein